jgi:hypothetical protein
MPKTVRRSGKLPVSGTSPEPSSSATAQEQPPGRMSEEKAEALKELLRQWREEGDPEEQRETFEALKKAVDEDRLSDRKRFT